MVYWGTTKPKKLLSGEDNIELQQIYDEAGVIGLGLCTIGMKSYTHWRVASFWWIIIILALALIFFAVLCIIAIYILWGRYKKYMDTHKIYVGVTPVYEKKALVTESPSTLYVIFGQEQPAPVR